MQIVTAGWPYLDIDAYAGIIGYAELLNLKQIKASAISTAPLNESIPPIVREWETSLQRTYNPSNNDKFRLVDLSDPDYFEKFVDLDRVNEVIDHHVGFEEYWQAKIGAGARIEFIGAACTLIFESWKEAGLLSQISETSARLLVCGILDNTLNFGADVTTNRDEAAYRELLHYANLPENWTELYFEDCERAITDNLEQSLGKDTKTVNFNGFLEGTVGFAQAVVWDGRAFADEYMKDIRDCMNRDHRHWFMNVIGLKDKHSRFLVSDTGTESWLVGLLKLSKQDGIPQADRLWLRKEVLKRDQDLSSES